MEGAHPERQRAVAVAAVLDHARSRPASLGSGRLICIDGPAGSGKTTLAAAVATAARRHGSVTLEHLDDHYRGWSGLDDVDSRVAAEVMTPLATGRPGHYRCYDWHRATWAEQRRIEPSDWFVLEGVGAGSELLRPWCTTLVWVEAPPAVRWERVLARDGAAQREHLEEWVRQEALHFARHATSRRADLRVDGDGRLGAPPGITPAAEPPRSDTS